MYVKAEERFISFFIFTAHQPTFRGIYAYNTPYRTVLSLLCVLVSHRSVVQIVRLLKRRFAALFTPGLIVSSVLDLTNFNIAVTSRQRVARLCVCDIISAYNYALCLLRESWVRERRPRSGQWHVAHRAFTYSGVSRIYFHGGGLTSRKYQAQLWFICRRNWKRLRGL